MRVIDQNKNERARSKQKEDLKSKLNINEKL